MTRPTALLTPDILSTQHSCVNVNLTSSSKYAHAHEDNHAINLYIISIISIIIDTLIPNNTQYTHSTQQLFQEAEILVQHQGSPLVLVTLLAVAALTSLVLLV